MTARRRRKEREFRREEARKPISDKVFFHISTIMSVLFAITFSHDLLSDGLLVIRRKEIPAPIAVVIVIMFIALAIALVRQSWHELNADTSE